jgi:hypothetical protein
MRTQDQTDAARFWGVGNAVGTWAMLLRTIADQHPMTTADSARYYAMLYITAADSLITTWDVAHGKDLPRRAAQLAGRTVSRSGR